MLWKVYSKIPSLILKRMKKTKKTDINKAWNRKLETKKIPVEEIEKGKSFLIICEGQNTEPGYFKSIPVGNADVETYGLGQSKTALVKYVLELLKADKNSNNREVWVVFDMDIKEDQHSQQKEDYNRAIDLAKANSINVGYSNDSFELWFLLHYQYLDSQLNRRQYFEKLSQYWQCNYEKEGKTDSFCRKIYNRLEDDERADQLKASERAEKLLNMQSSLPYSDQNPCTTVFKLIRELIPDKQP